MAEAKEPFNPKSYHPAVAGYYTAPSGEMLSFPFNSSTPVVYWNKDAFKKAGLDPDKPPTTWPEVAKAADIRWLMLALGFELVSILLRALRLGVLDLLHQARHVEARAPVEHADLGAEAPGRAGAVHRGVAAAEHDDLAGDAGVVTGVDAVQEVDALLDAFDLAATLG